MNTAKQAMENMEYVRRLLKEKQAEFAASGELAVSFIYRQIEWPQEMMEMTLPPGRRETIEKQDRCTSGAWPGSRAWASPGRWPKLSPAMLTGTRWRRWCGGAALRGSHFASSADAGRLLK
jgi:hypothetical protein